MKNIFKISGMSDNIWNLIQQLEYKDDINTYNLCLKHLNIIKDNRVNTAGYRLYLPIYTSIKLEDFIYLKSDVNMQDCLLLKSYSEINEDSEIIDQLIDLSEDFSLKIKYIKLQALYSVEESFYIDYGVLVDSSIKQYNNQIDYVMNCDFVT
jgi:hypothetical protein